MIFNNVLQSSPADKFRKLEKVLMKEAKVDLSKYKSMDSDQLNAEIHRLEERSKVMRRQIPYGRLMRDRGYGRVKMMSEALSLLAEHVSAKEASTKLYPGMTYYRNCKRVGSMVYGERCTYLGEDREDIISWCGFADSVRKLKILESLRYGSDEQFSHIYFKLANGRSLDSMNGFIVEHLVESTEPAMIAMEKYCDSIWEGPWPWEVKAPKKIRDIMEDNERMRNAKIRQIRESFNDVMIELTEGEVEQSQVIISARDVIDRIDDMIHKLGKISAEAMTELKDKVRTEYGDSLAKDLENATNEGVGGSVDALSKLKEAIRQEIKKMEEQLGHDPLQNNLDDIDAEFDDDDMEDHDGGKIGKDLGDLESPDDLDDVDMDDMDDVDMDDDDDEGEREKK